MADLADAPADASLRFPADEWDAIALNYTSGTTGNPAPNTLLPPEREANGSHRRNDTRQYY